jgi:bifunctional non-homologous end joining protein LigD
VHVRGSLMAATDRCDRIVFDLDPGDDVAWRDVVAAAREVRDRLAKLELESFVKLTGGKGLHVMLPVAPVDWNTAKVFANAVALSMASDEPRRYVAQVTKSLRKGRVYVDYLRNSHEATSVAVYSSRARAGAPVAAPVTWQELGRTRAGNQYDVRTLLTRAASQKSDPWAEMSRIKQKLPEFERKRGR